jgi:hypothetical protein
MSSVLAGAAAFLLFVLVTWLVFHLPAGSDASAPRRLRWLRWLRRGRDRSRDRGAGPVVPAAPERPRRPIEDIVSDARRYASRVHEPPRGTSYAKHVAACTVYDRVLGEACAALDIEHLLGVLPPGEERDAERTRIETALWLAGLRLEDAA